MANAETPMFEMERRPVLVSGTPPDLGDDRLNEIALTLLQSQAEADAANEDRWQTLKQKVIDILAEALSGPDDELDDIGNDGGGGSAAFSIRYRNDTQDAADPNGTHRLEWIAKSTATDPSTGLPWLDAEWNAVLNGDAILMLGG